MSGLDGTTVFLVLALIVCSMSFRAAKKIAAKKPSARVKTTDTSLGVCAGHKAKGKRKKGVRETCLFLVVKERLSDTSNSALPNSTGNRTLLDFSSRH